MARLNIDYDEMKKDERIYPGLVDRLGEADALLLLVRFWNSAQKSWAMGDLKPKGRPLGRIQVSDDITCDWAQLLPYDKFRLLHPKADQLFETGLAQLVSHGSEQRVYACGAQERFKWYRAICLNGQSGVDARQAAAGEPKGQPPAPPAPEDEDVPEFVPEEPKGQPKGQPTGEPNGRPKGEPSSSLLFSTSQTTPQSPPVTGHSPPVEVDERQGASSVEVTRDDAQGAANEVLRALDEGWSAERMRRELSTLAQLLAAKRYGKAELMIEHSIRARAKDLEGFERNLRRAFAAARKSLSGQGPPGKTSQ